MDLFEHYEEDFLEIKTAFEQKLKNIPNLYGSKLKWDHKLLYGLFFVTNSRDWALKPLFLVSRQDEIRNAESDIQDAEQTVSIHPDK
jgi:hypothetical protein